MLSQPAERKVRLQHSKKLPAHSYYSTEQLIHLLPMYYNHNE